MGLYSAEVQPDQMDWVEPYSAEVQPDRTDWVELYSAEVEPDRTDLVELYSVEVPPDRMNLVVVALELLGQLGAFQEPELLVAQRQKPEPVLYRP